ncbi:MAG: hypothetical protein KJO36_06065 [Acidimicrobiia bacterium]|nr:hypothetical protein [Acidimicrobiia bacterium]
MNFATLALALCLAAPPSDPEAVSSATFRLERGTTGVVELHLDLVDFEAAGYQAFLKLPEAYTFAFAYTPDPFGLPIMLDGVRVSDDGKCLAMAAGIDFLAGQPTTSTGGLLIVLMFTDKAGAPTDPGFVDFTTWPDKTLPSVPSRVTDLMGEQPEVYVFEGLPS